MTGHRLKAKELVQWGIATHFVPQVGIEPLYRDLAERVRPTSSNQDIEAIVRSHSDPSAGSTPIPHQDEINSIFREDSVQQIFERLHHSESDFATKVKKQIAPLSALSMAIVFEQIKRGKNMTLKEVFEMEYKISQGFVHHTEFFEGVRALLIDKDKNPKWKYASVN